MALSRSIENSLSLSSSFYVGGGGSYCTHPLFPLCAKKRRERELAKTEGDIAKKEEEESRQDQQHVAAPVCCNAAGGGERSPLDAHRLREMGWGGPKREKEWRSRISHCWRVKRTKGHVTGIPHYIARWGKGGMWRRMNADIGRSGS